MNVDLTKLKLTVHEMCLQSVTTRIDDLNTAMRDFQEASSLETKSSAGDKYETGRELMQLEKEKIAAQLENALAQRKVLNQLQPQKEQKSVALGSLIETDQGLFYLCIGMGMLEADQKVFCLSAAAPLGKAFLGAKPDREVEFNKIRYKILRVV